MTEEGNEFGVNTPYGSALVRVGQTEQRSGHFFWGSKLRPTWNTGQAIRKKGQAIGNKGQAIGNKGQAIGTKVRPLGTKVRPLGSKLRPTNEKGH